MKSLSLVELPHIRGLPYCKSHDLALELTDVKASAMPSPTATARRHPRKRLRLPTRSRESG